MVFWCACRYFWHASFYPLYHRRPHPPTPQLTYHGKLTDTNNIPVADGTYNFTISIYDAPTGGNCLWTARGTCAAKQAKTLTITKGIFHTTLGETHDNPLTLDFNQDYYLEIQINTNAPMSPRRTITPTGSAINAERLNGKTADNYINTTDNQTKAGTLTLSNNLTLNSTLTDRNNSTGTNNQILTSTATGVQWATASALGLGDGTFLGLTDTPNTYSTGHLLRSTSTGLEFFDGASAYWMLGGNTLTTNQTLGTLNSYALTFITDNQERMRLTETGNLGLGTTTPTAKLNIQSTTEQLRLNYDANNHLAVNTNNTGYTTLDATGSNSGIRLKSNTGTTQENSICSAKFPLIDYSNARNDYGGFRNSPNYPNFTAFAFIKADGSITAWGDAYYGGSGAPTDSGYTQIYSTSYAFAALKADGSIVAWGDSNYGGTGAPTDSGYTQIYSSYHAFAALKADGSITAWGDADYGGSSAPTDSGYTHIYSTEYAFAALKSDGSITAWGSSDGGGSGAPTDSGYTQIYSNYYAFAALKADGSITAWGDADYGGSSAPTDSGYTHIYSTEYAFAALKADGSITAWGDAYSGGSGAPTDSGYTHIYSTDYAFAALKSDGSITAWGYADEGGSGAPTDSGYTQIYSTDTAFAALKSDGSITAWGDAYSGGSGAPTDSGYTQIYSNYYAFAALKADGSITAWGDADEGGSGAPTDSGYTQIYSTRRAFAALKSDGSITAWGDAYYGGTGAPTSTCVNTTISTQTTISTATELALDVNGLTYRDSLNNLIFKADPRGVGSGTTATLTVNGSINPFSNGIYNLGSSINRWNTIYAINGTINTSDTNQKKNINTLNYGLNEILNINPISFNWKDDELGKNKKLGFSAQELQGIIPEVVSQGQDGLLGVYYSDLIPVAFNAIKQQQQLIHTNTNTITQHTGILQKVQSDITAQNTKADHITHIQKLQTDILTLKQDTQNYHTVIDDLKLQLEQAQAGIDLLTAMSTQQTTDLTALLAIDPGRIVLWDVDAAGALTNTITLDGIMVVRRVTTESLVMTGDADRATIGEAVIAKDAVDVFVPTTAVVAASRIFITPKGGAVDQALSVSSIDEGSGFHVTVVRPVGADVAFDWMIVEDGIDRPTVTARDPVELSVDAATIPIPEPTADTPIVNP